MAAVITFSVVLLRAQCPELASETTYPDAVLEAAWGRATLHISDVDYGYLQGAARAYALNLMTAHLIKIDGLVAAGQTSAPIASSSIDGVSASLAVPPTRKTWDFWLASTERGKQLLDLLASKAYGSLWVGGSPERSALRRVGGRVF